MRRALIILGTIAAIPVLLAVLLLGRGIVLQLMGYPVDIPPSELADEIAAENGDPLRCRRLQQTVPTMGPSLAEKRMLCFFLLAQKKKDPSICELLLPSDYGWSCLGEISGAVFEGKPCRYSSVSDDVYCNKSFSEGELTIEHPQMENCSLYKRNDLREWCYFERTAQLKETHECNAISHPIVHDYCEYNYAIKMRDPLLCSAVKDKKRQDFCTTYVSLSVKYRGSVSTVP